MIAGSISTKMGGDCIGLCPLAALPMIARPVDDESRQAEDSGSRQRDSEATNSNQLFTGAANTWWQAMMMATMVARRRATTTAWHQTMSARGQRSERGMIYDDTLQPTID